MSDLNQGKLGTIPSLSFPRSYFINTRSSITDLSGTKSEFDAACTNGNFAFEDDLAMKQQIDDGLTEIATLTTTTYGRSLLTITSLIAEIITLIDTASGGPGTVGASVLRHNDTTLIWSALYGSITLRGIYYPDSSFSNTLDTSKAALLPSQTASLNNVTSYTYGITGIQVNMLGIAVFPGLTGADILNSFSFATWNGVGSQDWVAYSGTTPTCTLTYVSGESTEIRIVFPNSSIINTYLRVTIASDAQTNLTAPDVFYFGSARHSVGGSVGSGNVRCSTTDRATINANYGTALVTNIYDLNKSGIVDVADGDLCATTISNTVLIKIGWVA